jgi:hypothetical protein
VAAALARLLVAVRAVDIVLAASWWQRPSEDTHYALLSLRRAAMACGSILSVLLGATALDAGRRGTMNATGAARRPVWLRAMLACSANFKVRVEFMTRFS